MEELVEEAKELAARGIRELIIIAQDTTYYGLDLYGRRALAELLRKLSYVDGIEWLRIHYSYPADFPEDVLEEMARNPKVCKYMDIPLQHVSDRVLDKMHRHVDGAWTRELIRRMREKVPGVALRTTLIVGHPGEGQEGLRRNCWILSARPASSGWAPSPIPRRKAPTGPSTSRTAFPPAPNKSGWIR